MSFLFLASEAATHEGLWDPFLRGLLVVAFGVALFWGSVYLLLGTNVGARLGFLLAFSGLMGFMTLLSLFWLTTATPITSLHGAESKWKVEEVVEAPYGESQFGAVRGIERTGDKVDDVATNELRAAADSVLVEAEGATEEEAALARFSQSNEYVQVGPALEVGGGRDGLFGHHPLYAAMTVQEAATKVNVIGEEEPTTEADPSGKRYSVVLVRDLGSLRLPPLVALAGSLAFFALSLLALHWHEQDALEAAGAPRPATA